MPKLTPRKIKKYGWKPDVPDVRDVCLSYARPSVVLPPFADLRSGLPPCYDQGNLGSCTANAIAGAIQFAQRKQRIEEFTPSRLFIYYNERVIENTIDEDSGAQIRDGIKSVNVLGAPPEALWKYRVKQFAKKPSDKAFKVAADHQALKYARVPQDEKSLKQCLANGYPIIFGFGVYPSFESPEVERTGELPMPKPEEPMIGGHAVLAVGYNDTTRRFTVRNSWGERWGVNGHYYMPYDYLTNRLLADDFWMIRIMENV